MDKRESPSDGTRLTCKLVMNVIIIFDNYDNQSNTSKII